MTSKYILYSVMQTFRHSNFTFFLIYFDEYFLFFNKKLLLFSSSINDIRNERRLIYTVGPLCTINVIIIKVSLVIFSLLKYLHNGKSRSISAFFMVYDCTQL